MSLSRCQRSGKQPHTSRVNSDWIQLFDGKTLNGWVHMNGAHNFDVEDGAIVGRTVEGSAQLIPVFAARVR